MDDAAREILREVKIANLATVDPSGAPRATPVHFATDGTYIYWISDRESVHSRNLAQNDHLSFSVWYYPEGAAPAGLYVQTRAEMLSREDDAVARETYLEKFGGIPPHFADHDFYRAAIGTPDDALTKPLRWYFTA
jgi:uncharacterized pyridoxamine 5'-phosphate oxidase family protein